VGSLKHVTADQVATAQYANNQDRALAIYEHGVRVIRARRRDPGSPLAKEVILTMSGTTIMRAPWDGLPMAYREYDDDEPQ